jgi:acetyl-CoA carboxylase biotin carboxyl carrier protein
VEDGMDVDKIFSLIDKAEASSFDRIEIQIQDVRICLERNRNVPETGLAGSAPAREAAPSKEFETEDIIFAPISGVFYAAKEPDAEPYVRECQHVHKGEPICIIEAMKMMNEICAPKSGVIERIFVENSQAITGGEALFLYAKEA